MSDTRDFDAMLAEKAGRRPTFKVAGQEFSLRTKLPYAKWTKLVAAMRSEEADDMAATEDFFRTVLVRADRQRFLDLLERDGDDDDDDDVIGIDQLSELTSWAMEHFTGKAPSDSDSSSPGVNGTGPAPNVVSLSSKKPANA